MCRKSLWTLGLSLVAVALVASPVMAQQGRGRGGFGLFGRGQQSLISLAGNEAVQKDLGVTDASKLNSLAEEYREAIRQEMSSSGIDFQGLRDLPEAERDAKLREFQSKSEAATKKVNESLEPKLKEALTADQLKRLGEIKIQAAGIAALLDAAVVKELGITDEQQKKITAIRDESDRARNELTAGLRGGGNVQEAMAKIRELSAQSLTKATDVLDASQKEKFAALKGKPFDVAQLGFGGRGGQRRGNN
jgi:hypothetical protein